MLTSEKVRSMFNKVGEDGAKLLQHTKNGIVFAIDDIADEIAELEAELAAHLKNEGEGDECPLCELEAKLTAMQCAECEETMLDCRCEDA